MQNDRRDQKELKNRAWDIVDKEIVIKCIGMEEEIMQRWRNHFEKVVGKNMDEKLKNIVMNREMRQKR